jgi:hypothetical protein
MKRLLTVITFLSAVLFSACGTNRPEASPTSSTAVLKVASELSPELLNRLSNLLSKNPDLRTAYLVTEPSGKSYVLIPTFDGPPNMTSLYEALDLFKALVPNSQLNLALLTPATIKRTLSHATPFYVRP